jgi:hypothetical protein
VENCAEKFFTRQHSELQQNSIPKECVDEGFISSSISNFD